MPNLIGTAPNQVPVNGLLGKMAFQDSNSVIISGGSIGGVPVSSLAAAVLQGEQLDTIASSSSLVLRGGATNLATQSQTFTTWPKTATTVTNGVVIAPDGTLTGSILVPTAVSTSHLMFFSGGLGIGTFTFSVYAKQGGYPRLGIRVYDGAAYQMYATFDISNGTIVTSTAGTNTITPVGNGWYRCICTGSTASGNMGASTGWVIESMPADKTVQQTFTGDGTSGAYIWGGQIEASPTAGAYLKTEATAVSTAYAAPIESPNGVAVPLLASMTPARNGDMTFQLTSNTSLTIKVKGSDGTVRSVALTLA